MVELAWLDRHQDSAIFDMRRSAIKKLLELSQSTENHGEIIATLDEWRKFEKSEIACDMNVTTYCPLGTEESDLGGIQESFHSANEVFQDSEYETHNFKSSRQENPTHRSHSKDETTSPSLGSEAPGLSDCPGDSMRQQSRVGAPRSPSSELEKCHLQNMEASKHDIVTGRKSLEPCMSRDESGSIGTTVTTSTKSSTKYIPLSALDDKEKSMQSTRRSENDQAISNRQHGHQRETTPGNRNNSDEEKPRKLRKKTRGRKKRTKKLNDAATNDAEASTHELDKSSSNLIRFMEGLSGSLLSWLLDSGLDTEVFKTAAEIRLQVKTDLIPDISHLLSQSTLPSVGNIDEVMQLLLHYNTSPHSLPFSTRVLILFLRQLTLVMIERLLEVLDKVRHALSQWCWGMMDIGNPRCVRFPRGSSAGVGLNPIIP
jgi:hypothetical protein